MAKKLNDAAGPSDDLIQQFYAELSKATRTKDEAVASVRAVLKRAKGAGVAPSMLSGMIADKKRDPDELKIELQQRIRGLAFINMPVTQQDLFGDDGDEAYTPQLSPKVRAQAEKLDVEAAGYQAGLDERSADENPHQAGSEFHQAWNSHWAEGVARRAELDAGDGDDEVDELAKDAEPAPKVVKASTARKRRSLPGVMGHA